MYQRQLVFKLDHWAGGGRIRRAPRRSKGPRAVTELRSNKVSDWGEKLT